MATSDDRRKARREREDARRQAKKEERLKEIKSSDEVFTFDNLYKCGKECTKNVRWKQSTRDFERHLFSNTGKAVRRTRDQDYKPLKLKEFDINERGKQRHIQAPNIKDRQIQKAICKEVLLPLYQPSLIYDNCASLEGKGLGMSREILLNGLNRHLNTYGLNGWIIIADYKGFFPNADRDVVKARHQVLKEQDPKMVQVLDAITDIGAGDVGLPLGVEPSQLEMVSLPSPIDNYMACQVGVQGFGHYMDDYHILVPPHRDPNEILNIFINKSKEYNIIVNLAKTKIIPFGRPFKFCKITYYYDGTKWVMRSNSEAESRLRSKIKYFANSAYKLKDDYQGEDKLEWTDIYSSIQSSLSQFDNTNNYFTKQRLKEDIKEMFKAFDRAGIIIDENQKRSLLER